MPLPNSPVLTVILAVKNPHAGQFEACVASIAALRNSHLFDVVIVRSSQIPEISHSVRSRVHDIRIIEQEPRGVYQAYNRGLDDVHTPYVLVMGCDDILLPGLDNVVELIADRRMPHVIAARVLMQDIGIVRPSRVRWGLIFRNWCQQGILYRADLFATRRFDCKYAIRADQKLNMELASHPDTEIEYRDDVVCHFSSSGLSQTVIDWVFREDMPHIVRGYYGFWWGVVALMKWKLVNLLERRSRQKHGGAGRAFPENVPKYLEQANQEYDVHSMQAPIEVPTAVRSETGTTD
jgi:glycosyltransferase involved in cell wall biosynthesis